ncbi:hypothetical protein [Chryseobacterium limigenitum]|uniref:Uncharacterized protein n=1 Tax=Chryseobacterium limigenitum TaxID=1612149 RepID=A0A1K2IXY9_9FLAO|nr:hypothetical protein [Chryseobacterium limigenitum]SFZ97142.1 hypothetical protein SAMN05216324_1464 [Chryseobacterium limigenitum]
MSNILAFATCDKGLIDLQEKKILSYPKIENESTNKNQFYSLDGEFLCYDIEVGNSVFIIDKDIYLTFLPKTYLEEKNNIIDYDKLKESSVKLNIEQYAFERIASIIYAESSINKSVIKTEELLSEMTAMAFILNKYPKTIAFGENSETANKLNYSIAGDRNKNKRMKLAFKGLINALIDNEDLSNGATKWDGQEQSFFADSENSQSVLLETSRGTISIKLHMNIMGWTILDEHYDKWKSNIGIKFKAPQEKYATVGSNKDKIRYESTAVYGLTIFWRIVNKKK